MSAEKCIGHKLAVWPEAGMWNCRTSCRVRLYRVCTLVVLPLAALGMSVWVRTSGWSHNVQSWGSCIVKSEPHFFPSSPPCFVEYFIMFPSLHKVIIRKVSFTHCSVCQLFSGRTLVSWTTAWQKEIQQVNFLSLQICARRMVNCCICICHMAV